ncbi:uncharacterized protein LOC133716544 [Rosa rugosa]|uniref:uncharacterized protein LOC133716544 n=1 Tax=Rosa rugosa TaxID=74645 RepID=UPI002B403CB7|nr:uncharacterized protein LOC133716544 [Rosa rugosa]
MKDCKSLRRLPKTIGMLKLLDTLIISGCSNLDNSSIEVIRSMESLKVLELDRIPMSQLFTPHREVKSGTYLPCSLLSLSLSGCNLSDDAFPVDFSSLSLLRSLNLSENPISGLPNCIKGMTSIDELSFSNCLRLESLVELPKVRNELNVSGCEALVKITYQSNSYAQFPRRSGKNHSLCEWEYEYKLEPIGRVDVEMLNLLGLSKLDFEFMPNVRICKPYQGYDVLHQGGIQGLHEYDCTDSYIRGNARKLDMFSTFLPGNAVPGQFSYRTKGSSSISLTLPLPSLPEIRIRGFNIFIVYAVSDNDDERYSSSSDQGSITIKIINESKDDNWHYGPIYHGIPGKGEDMIWLTHWNMKNQVKGGDQMAVSLSVNHARFRYQVKEWGIQVVQEKQEDKTCTDHYTTNPISFPCATGGDLLTSDEPLRGTYLLSCEPHSTVDKDKKEDDEEEAVGDPIPASAMGDGSNNSDRGLRKWKVLIIAAIILAAAISAAHRFEESDLDTNLAETVTNADNEEEQRDEDDKLATATDTDSSTNRARDPRKWKVLIIAAVILILCLSVRWFFFFSARDRYMESILVPT